MKPLTATLRLQFHSDFTLDHAVPLVPYFAQLGISHLYASPILKARAGSRHGYDVVDPTCVNPELGGEAALQRLVAALRQHGMGLILDTVSNHMAVGGADNPWWQSLLAWGRRSPYAEFFDIQWHSSDPLLAGQLLLPFLGSDYGVALKNGDIPLEFDKQQGTLQIAHYDHRFPICPVDYGWILALSPEPALKALAEHFTALAESTTPLADALALHTELARLVREGADLESALVAFDSRAENGFKRLHLLLERQTYRLASWRTAADDINWRRFFDINELGGLRVERAVVFEATHAKLFELIERGLVDGLRIDHIDGLADPRGYCRKLRRRVDGLLAQRPLSAALEHFPIYVEKILGADEHLHRDWLTDGTTGYEFMNQVSLLQHDPAGEAPLSELWANLSERPDFPEEVRQARHLVLNASLAGDCESVALALLQVARNDLMTRDLTLGAIRRALQALVAHYPVYRTYFNACGRPAEDERFFQQALVNARQDLGEADWPLLEQLERWLGGQAWRHLPPGRARKQLRHACVRFQQLTAPSAAKAVEDTAFYRNARLLSRNDVGFEAEHFSAAPAHFHNEAQRRLRDFPDNLLATATHDHKRGEDTRARLAVLSERGPWLASRVEHWRELAAPLRTLLDDGPAPSPGDELMLLQTLLGSWPLTLDLQDTGGLRTYAERIRQWQQKALREAKLRSSWNAPNEAYESACTRYVDGLLLDSENQQLRKSVADAAQLLACPGALNGLVQTLLRMTTPGVPDLYQGNEYWDFSLVDPDNRRAVDYACRRRTLDDATAPAELLTHWRDGRIKQALIAKVLDCRQAHADLFRRGAYLPLSVQGRHADNVIAFARLGEGERAVIVAPRLASSLLGGATTPLIPAQNWDDTRLVLPFALSTANSTGLFPCAAVSSSKELMLSAVLAEFPVNLLIQQS
ncbi:malto-oligosyltrehalose synthase [Pseudomonas putida]|jgi:(1->4)-alpha-D-glucan 1-alpha-D-glucosylmutase|uniref:Malto-oligosyltrehalose synthase n=1 Tax=Pseudomonas putida (strain GB-1) TaxID=76869 RepID=B0KMT9_PSEPG|nr:MULTISPECIES: malto-oligosyltrehalose synthase [Pseudomonas]ABY99543.1 malto-oligosyltrehalose synthase [Pseudomonas putida GB-1]MBP0707158.1 malto-oligosyltrehalose synthase [Pseudomonas sp. T34]MCK2186598.1 malto-oligosyltrehalose synthase [Pseudomonas sp. MB04B]MDD2083295.1 malto-oligosyltrehalose synthase [Pseudomonas putida]MDD2093803.1 malto-oligosyltrehalose synthase [Pseudomonas putida]